MAKKKRQEVSFDDKLVLFRYCLDEMGIHDWRLLGETLNRPEEEGMDTTTDHTRFLDHLLLLRDCRISPDKLREYDSNIVRHTRQIGRNRGGLTWKYFQYIALLLTERYLDRYFSDSEGLCRDLNLYMDLLCDQSRGRISFSTPYDAKRLNKLAFMSATGSGKTLLLHVNLLQYLHYMRRAQRSDRRVGINKVLLLTPNEGMSRQHAEELALSGITSYIFQKDSRQQGDVCIIDINKLDEETKDKLVSVDSFEKNNLLLVDEGHRGLSGDGKVWLSYRRRMAEDGFTFEYSATFKQALNVNATAAKDRDLADDYCKAIIMDYSYKYFYADGYGKDSRIFNLTTDDRELRAVYLTGCLLSFYQQKRCFCEYRRQIAPFNIEDPLMVFVGNRVTEKTEKKDLTDVEDVLVFIEQFVRDRRQSLRRLQLVLDGQTGLLNEDNDDLFAHDFTPLREMAHGQPDVGRVFDDMLRLVFNAATFAEAPRLHAVHLTQHGEIALRVGEDGGYFGVVSIGDPARLMELLRGREIVAGRDPVQGTSLFAEINRRNPKHRVNVLIGSRKFTEGWNSWRVSTIGLVNFAKGRGSQAIQMFGRGVRLKGYMGLLKRSSKLGGSVHAPSVAHIDKLETLTIFGIKADYMAEFRKFLELEGVSGHEGLTGVVLPVISRYEEAKERRLRVIRVRGEKDFRRDAHRLLLCKPDDKFGAYLQKNRVCIDCRSKVLTIDRTEHTAIGTQPTEVELPAEVLDMLDLHYIYDELIDYKNLKAYYNLSIDERNLKWILADTAWYRFVIPQERLVIDSMQRLQAMNEFCLMALKAYVERFYRFERERWESRYLEYAELEADDGNFEKEYRLRLSEDPGGQYGKELKRFIRDMTAMLDSQHALDSYNMRRALGNNLTLLDLPQHLYVPLVSLRQSNLKIEVTPVSLNKGERTFVDYLHSFVNNTEHREWLAGKSLYLLRNKSKSGIGFFEAGNFYPDFILWIDTPQVQYISFVDPKGLLRISPNSEKIEFYKKIKELERRLAPSATDKQMVLSSFIMSATPAAELQLQWGMTAADYEAKNVYTLDDPLCVEKMLGKICPAPSHK